MVMIFGVLIVVHAEGGIDVAEVVQLFEGLFGEMSMALESLPKMATLGVQIRAHSFRILVQEGLYGVALQKKNST